MGSWWSRSKVTPEIPPVLEVLEFPTAPDLTSKIESGFLFYQKLSDYLKNDIYTVLRKKFADIVLLETNVSLDEYEQRYRECSKVTSNRLQNITILSKLFDEFSDFIGDKVPSKEEYRMLLKIALQIKVLTIKEREELREKLLIIDESRLLKLEKGDV